MSRNSSGTYSLPAGNPVVSGEVISSSWANTTLADIATALTDSLSRTGQGGMLAPLELDDGAIGAPALTWSSETTAGLYRSGAADFRFSVTGSDVFGASSIFTAYAKSLFSGASTAATNGHSVNIGSTAPGIMLDENDAAANNRYWNILVTGEQLRFGVYNDVFGVNTNWMTVDRTGTTIDTITFPSGQIVINAVGSSSSPTVSIASSRPVFEFNETDAAVNNRRWNIQTQSEQLTIEAVTDAGSGGTPALTIDRTGNVIDTVNFTAGTLQYGGNEVGYRGLINNDQNGNYSLQQTDNGRMVTYSGAGGHTYTLASLTNTTLITIRNGGSGNLTLSPASALAWYNGSGAISTGNRTLAVGGIVTVWSPGSGNWAVWGTGLS